MAITHSFVSAIADGADTSLVRPSDWNQDHVGTLDHGSGLTGLTDDDHSGAAWLAGRSGGQTLIGGTAANDDITIKGTSHATKTTSYVLLQPDGGNVGIGTSSPGYDLDVVSSADAGSGNDFIAHFSSASAYSGLLVDATKSDNTGQPNFFFAKKGVNIFQFGVDLLGNGTNDFFIHSAGVATRFYIGSNGNIGVGTTAPGGGSTVGTKVFSLTNATAPVGGVANQVSLYSADTAASAELFALDEAGNAPQLTPHPADFLDTFPVTLNGPYAYPWAYSAKNHYLGKKIQADLAGLFAWAISQGAPSSLVAVTDLPPEERANWDAGQETQRQGRQAEITRAQAQIVDLNAEIAKEKDAAKKAELMKRKDEITIPQAYTKKRPPKWMVDRGVATAIKEARP